VARLGYLAFDIVTPYCREYGLAGPTGRDALFRPAGADAGPGFG